MHIQRDAVGRMTSVNGGALGTFGYNGDGKRVKKVEGGATTYYVNSAMLGAAAFELNGTGTVNRVHVTAGGKEIAQLATDNSFYWLHTDHLGTPRRMTNSTGVVMFRGEYDPHGNPLLEWTTISNGKFTGYERDAAAGLDFAQARHYKFGRGRFMQPDPAGLEGAELRIPQSLNRYGYVINDPVNLIDKSGMFYGSPWCTSIYWDGLFMGGSCGGGFSFNVGMLLDGPLGVYDGGGGNPQPWEAPKCGVYGVGNAEEANNAPASLFMSLWLLIFQEVGGSGVEPDSVKAMQAITASVYNRKEFLNQPGLSQGDTAGFGSVGASLLDVIYSSGKTAATQYAGFETDKNGTKTVSSGIRDKFVRANNSDIYSPDCLKLTSASIVANEFITGNGQDPFSGKTWGVRTTGSGSPGWGGQQYELGKLMGQTFYGWSGWK